MEKFIINVLDRMLIYLDKTYQDGKRLKTVDQFNLIYPIIQNTKYPRNILEIGTNKGNLIRLFSKNDFISTGVDIKSHHRDLNNVILGVIDVTKISIGNFPNFSYVFMLSVHHQLISLHGESYTLKILNDLSNITRAAIFIEFAALN